MQTKIKTLKSYLGILLFLSIFLVGCSSSDDSAPSPDPTPVNPDDPPAPYPDPEPDPNPSPFPIPTTAQFNALRENALNSKKQTFVFKVINGSGFSGTITSEKGVTTTITASDLKIDGIPLEVGSNAQLQFTELYNKADFITTGFSTMGIQDNQDLQMLETGGTFHLEVEQGGQTITSFYYFSYSTAISPMLTGGVKSNMSLWKENSTNQENYWENGISTGSNLTVTGNNYVASILNFPNNWVNIGRFWEDSRPKASALSVGVPDGYNQSNSAVYISFNGVWGVGQVYYNTTTNSFSDAGNYIPVGQQANAIFVSESAGKWVYAIKPFTVIQNTNVEILGTDLEAVTEAEITTLINALP